LGIIQQGLQILQDEKHNVSPNGTSF
jgi:hypothetical protein